MSFARPDCSYVKGSYALANTGLSFSSDGPTVRDAVAALKRAQPNTRVMLAVGGATYTNFAGAHAEGCVWAGRRIMGPACRTSDPDGPLDPG
jgi:hypothetical protein